MRNLIVCIIFVICFLSIGCSYHWVKVPTGAMQPTIKVDANVITDETAYSSSQPIERFDIVIHKAQLMKICGHSALMKTLNLFFA